ncbi:sigma-54-dependent Fis family transcriptional regulator, partial [Candidatus Poribacteria bacterium]|nr:sigma-54-dependent Fis family transcriptional regulator [Candidatus Poribacteria bacterium]
QAQLLRVIEDGCVSPIGGTTEKQVDVRVIAATNADLMAKMKAGSFRKDLYFRLAQFTVNVPSLHERREDIPLLIKHFIKMFAQQMRIDTPTISAESLEALMAYSFPGNVRELKNLIERALIESGESAIQPEHLHFVCIPVSSATSDSEAPDGDLYDLPLKEARHAFEKRYLLRSLKDWLDNMTAVARRIGMDRSTLYDLLKKHKIDRRKINIDS